MLAAAGVLDAFMAGDLFNLYVAFEMLLVASYVLITLGGSEQRVRAGTTYIVTEPHRVGDLPSAIGLVYGATGTVNIAQISERVAGLPEHVQLLLHTMLLIGFGIKAAVFPLAFWLPDSYPTAPAPVTAVFAGLLTKVGIYAIIRSRPSSSRGRSSTTSCSSSRPDDGRRRARRRLADRRQATAVLHAHQPHRLHGDGHRLGSVVGTAAAVFYTVHHIVVQTTLFLVPASWSASAAPPRRGPLGGLLKAAPLLAALYLVPAFNLGGIPPFSGFIGNSGLFRAQPRTAPPWRWVTIGAGVVTSLLTLYALMRVWDAAFWRPKPAAEAAAPHASTAEPHAHLRSPETGAPHRVRGDRRGVPPGRLDHRHRRTPREQRLQSGHRADRSGRAVGAHAAAAHAGGRHDGGGPRFGRPDRRRRPLYGYATRAAESLESPDRYVQAVLGGAR